MSDITEDGCTMTFPQATDDEAVHRYVLEITGKDGRAVSSRTCFSGYYLNSRQPKSFTMTFNGIAEETELTARVRAIDSYNNESAPLVSETFRIAAYTPDPDTERPTADLLDVVWDSNGEATDISEQNSTITHGTELPVMADKASENGHVPHFSGNSQCYYRVDYAGNAAMKTAFQNAFSLETVYTPDNLSNMCVLSGQENGYAGLSRLRADRYASTPTWAAAIKSSKATSRPQRAKPTTWWPPTTLRQASHASLSTASRPEKWQPKAQWPSPATKTPTGHPIHLCRRAGRRP